MAGTNAELEAPPRILLPCPVPRTGGVNQHPGASDTHGIVTLASLMLPLCPAHELFHIWFLNELTSINISFKKE